MRHFLFLLVISVALASCSHDSFKIEGKITHLDNPTVRVLFQGDSGLVDESVNVEKGAFSYKGTASQPTIVTVLDMLGNPIGMMVAANGDHLKMEGDATRALVVKIKGNRLNEEWQLFKDEHAAFYSDINPSRLDAAIEKYVKDHPADMLSTVLLMADYSDYSDRAKVDGLLMSIEAKARPESLMRAMAGNSIGRKGTVLPRLMTLNLVRHGGGFEEVKLTDCVTLISLWAQPQGDRQAINQQLQDVIDSSEGAIRLIDVLTESDTLRWHQTIAKTPGRHYWAPGGPVEQGIQLLGVTSLPWFAVADSTGLVTYSGSNLTLAARAAKDCINRR